MKLKALLEDCDYEVVKGDDNVNIQYITELAEEVKDRSLFISSEENATLALEKTKKAIQNGAVAVLCTKGELFDGDVTIIKVSDARKAMANVSIKYFNNPAFNFRLVGVSGSTGKTPTITIISKIFKKIGKKIGKIDNNENVIDGKVLNEDVHQNSIKLQHLFHEMAVANVSAVIMEVSSRTIEIDRVHGVKYDISVLTNIKTGHHKFYDGLDNYINTKRKLFENSRMAVVNADDKSYSKVTAGIEFEKFLTYSLKNDMSDLFAYDINIDGDKLSFKFIYLDESYKVNINISEFQKNEEEAVYNVLAGIGTCILGNVKVRDIVEALND